jgi:type IV secretory pathway VirB10-like protein
MPTTIQTQQPRTISRTFGAVLALGILAGLTAIIFAMRRPAPEPTTPGLLGNTTNDDAWIERTKASPTPLAPRPMATVAPFKPPMPAPMPVFQRQILPRSAPIISEEERERRRRHQIALASDIGIKVNQQTLETPRMLPANTSPESKDSLHVNLTPPSPHTVTAFTWIDGTLETAIDSDHPGDVLGRVSADVKDSVTQTEILIPAGSILHGWHGGREQLDPNDTSLLVAWRDLEFPNGARVHLPDMPGSDTAGQPGFSDLIDHHYLRTWTPAVLISAITAGTALASHPTYGGLNGYSGEQQALGVGAESLGAHTIGQLGANLNTLKPTIRIEPGYRFRVLCTKDLVFSGAYSQ